MTNAFQGTRVIDLSRSLSGAWAARQFADYGAEVIMVEPPAGHPLRYEPPFARDANDETRALLHAYVNWNKQSLLAPEPSLLDQLVRDADVLVTTSAPPHDEAIATLIETLLEQGSVHLSITPHGLSGPLAGIPGNHLTHCARSGWSIVNSLEGEPPLQLPNPQAGYIAGIAGFVAAAAALHRSRTRRIGECVDVSELEAVASTSAPWALLGIFFNTRRLEHGPGGPHNRENPGPLWKTADGLINLGFGEWRNWRKAMEMFDLPEIGADPKLEPAHGRHGNDLRPVANALAEACSVRNKWDIFYGLADLHCISGVVQDTKGLIDNDHFKAREYFVEAQIGDRTAKAPGPPARLEATPWHLARPAPAPGEHDTLQPKADTPRARHSEDPALPLAGIRVLTFTQAWSGTFATEILSLLGADVVQIEGRKRPDVWRGGGAPVPKGVANPDIEQSPLNTNGMYNSVNLNKRAITLDMTQPEGQKIFWKMVPNFDIVAENFSPKVMGNWGITMDTLRQARPDIIFASLSGYGQDGPLSRFPANGNTTEPMSGLSSINGYEGDPGANTGGLCPDPISGYYFAGAILAAINHRDRTGEGQRIDLSMMEAVAVQLGERILGYTVNNRIAAPEGNRHPAMAPHNIYPATDGWVAISVENDLQWQALAKLIGNSDPRFTSLTGRKQHEVELDAIAARWCKQMPAEQLESTLIDAGICAAIARSFLEVYRSPPEQFLARDYLVPVAHPESGTHLMPTMPWVLQRTRAAPVTYSPRFGEHSREVFQTELNLSDEDYDRLEQLGITGTTRL